MWPAMTGRQLHHDTSAWLYPFALGMYEYRDRIQIEFWNLTALWLLIFASLLIKFNRGQSY